MTRGNGVEDIYATKEELRILSEAVNELTHNVALLVDVQSGQVQVLTNLVSGKLPLDCVPLETHRLVIRGVIGAFSVIIIAALGLVKFAPQILDKI